MQLSGNNYRSISFQTGVIDFLFSLTPPDVTNEIVFGFSGSNVFQFRLSNGKIYDNGGNFVDSYFSNSPLSFSGQLGQHTYDYYINNIIVGQDRPISTGEYKSIFLNTPSYNIVDFDATILGSIPIYSISNSANFTGQDITGYIINNTPSRQFRIFDIEILQTGTPFSISSFTTGNISDTGSFVISSNTGYLNSYPLSILANSNFGPISFDFFVSGNGLNISDFYLTLSPENTIAVNNVPSTYVTYFSNSPYSVNTTISLEYYSGVTGRIYRDLETGNFYSSVFSADLTGCAILSGAVSGIITGLDPLEFVTISGTGYGVLEYYACATGQVTLNYGQVLATGLAHTGDGFFVNASGYLPSGVLTGTATGCFSFNQIVTGSPLIAYTEFVGYNPATGFISYNGGTIQSGDTIYINSYPLIYSPAAFDEFDIYFHSFSMLSGLVNSGFVGVFNCTIDGSIPGANIISTANGSQGNGLLLSGSGSVGKPTFINPFLTGGRDFPISGTPSGIFYATVTGSACAVQTVTGYLTGILTGYVLALDYIREFTGLWNLNTGDINYRETGYFANNKYYNTGQIYFPSVSPNSFPFSIEYTNYGTPIVSTDIAKLIITGDFLTGLSYLISGF